MVCSGTAARFPLVTSSEVRATRSGSYFFGSQGDALRFVGERLADFEGGGWIHGEVTVYEPGGRLFDTFTADCRL